MRAPVRIDEAPRYTSLRDYLQVVRRRKWMLVAIMVLFGAAVLVHDKNQRRTYEAQAKVQFFDQQINPGLFGAIVPQDISPDQRAAIHAENSHTLQVAQRAAKTLHLPPRDARALLGSIDTQAEAVTDLVVITAASASPRGAQKFADAYAAATVAQAQSNLRAQYAQEVSGVKRQIAGLGASPSTGYFRALLTNQLQQLEQGGSVVNPAHVVQSAAVPTSPTSPRTSRDVLLGLLSGLVVAILIAFLRDTLDPRYNSASVVERELGLPILGLVRDEALGRVPGPGRRRLDEADVEGIRVLRSKLTMLDLQHRPQVVLVTSAVTEEGKSTVAAALAAAFAQAGRSTLLLESDLRKPTMSRRLGLSAEPGLTDCLVSTVDPRQHYRVAAASVRTGGVGAALVRTLPLPMLRAGGNVASVTNGVGFDCIVGGSPSPRPADLLGSEQMRTLLPHLRAVYEVIVIDAAPLLPVADTLELLPHVDAVAMCLRVSKTSREHARSAAATLAELASCPVGLVLTGVRSRDGYEAYAPYASSGARSVGVWRRVRAMARSS